MSRVRFQPKLAQEGPGRPLRSAILFALSTKNDHLHGLSSKRGGPTWHLFESRLRVCWGERGLAGCGTAEDRNIVGLRLDAVRVVSDADTRRSGSKKRRGESGILVPIPSLSEVRFVIVQARVVVNASNPGPLAS